VGGKRIPHDIVATVSNGSGSMLSAIIATHDSERASFPRWPRWFLSSPQALLPRWSLLMRLAMRPPRSREMQGAGSSVQLNPSGRGWKAAASTRSPG
jgi:hypothetical protein